MFLATNSVSCFKSKMQWMNTVQETKPGDGDLQCSWITTPNRPPGVDHPMFKDWLLPAKPDVKSGANIQRCQMQTLASGFSRANGGGNAVHAFGARQHLSPFRRGETAGPGQTLVEQHGTVEKGVIA